MWPVARVSRTETDTSAERTIIILVAGSVAAAKLIIVYLSLAVLVQFFFRSFSLISTYFFFFFSFWRGSRVISPPDTDRVYMSPAVCRLLAVWMFAYRQECAIQIRNAPDGVKNT